MNKHYFIKRILQISVISAVILILISQCSKIETNKDQKNNLLPKDIVFIPAFRSSDSIIVLKKYQTTYTIYLVAFDTLDYYYSTDGTTPCKNTSKYDVTKGINIGEGNYKIQVIAYSSTRTSAIAVRNFNISQLNPVTVSGIKTKTNYNNTVQIAISNYNSALQYTSKLNSKIINLSSTYTVSEPGFYSLKITTGDDSEQRLDSFVFVILDPAMNGSEWGLKTWVPAPFTENKLGSESLVTIYPKTFITGLNLPVILKTIDAGNVKPLYMKVTNSQNSNSYNIKRGIGSMNLLISNSVTSVDLDCGGKQFSLPVTCESSSWTVLSGTISSYNTGKNARIQIDANLTVPTGDTLNIGEGSIVAVNEAVDITNYGFIKIEGTPENPVIITCLNPNSYWGGFLSKGTGNSMEVSNAILCQSGYHETAPYQWGHAKRQALFYLEESTFKISDSYMIDHIGQVFYSTNADISINNILVQRAKTGGQVISSQINIDHSTFTDFPDDSYVFRDEDNDAIYIDQCDATIKNSTFMFTKDDGIDSGGSGGGTISVDNCWFESNFHEGLALSSMSPVTKTHNITNCTITNCQQGIELGYSSPNHVVNIDNCLIYANSIGLRYGDCYQNAVEGTMNISNTRSINNLEYDVWNMVYSLWAGRLDHMKFTNITVSMPSEQYPALYLMTGI